MASTAGQVIKCKAAVAWKAREPLVIEEVEVAPPQAMEVRIKILFTSLCQTDIYFWKDKGHMQIFPTIFGHEAGGIVESIGEGVTDLASGDHVILDFTGECKQCATDLAPGDNVLPIFTEKYKECAHCKFKAQLRINKYSGVMINDGKSRFSINGKPIYHFVGTSTFIEYTVVHVGTVAKINHEAPLDKVCILSCGISTGLGAALNVKNLPNDSTIAIFGLGDAGLAAAEGARIIGASRIISINMDSKRYIKAMKFGFTDFINPLSYGRELVSKYHGAVKLSIECTGNVSAMISAFECIDGRGVVVLVGVPDKDVVFQTHSFNLLNKRILKRTFVGDNKSRSDLPSLVEMYMSKKLELEKFITHEVPFSEINKAFNYMLQGESIRCIIHMDA